ncbi:hypothetical protein Aperf_G00000099375 [Anoplocephala perfoliata]
MSAITLEHDKEESMGTKAGNYHKLPYRRFYIKPLASKDMSSSSETSVDNDELASRLKWRDQFKLILEVGRTVEENSLREASLPNLNGSNGKKFEGVIRYLSGQSSNSLGGSSQNGTNIIPDTISQEPQSAPSNGNGGAKLVLAYDVLTRLLEEREPLSTMIEVKFSKPTPIAATSAATVTVEKQPKKM